MTLTLPLLHERSSSNQSTIKTISLSQHNHTLGSEFGRAKCSTFIGPRSNKLCVAFYSGKVVIFNEEVEQVVENDDEENKTYFSNENIILLEMNDDYSKRAVQCNEKFNYLAIGSDDYNIMVYDLKTMELKMVLKGHGDYVRSIALHPELPILISASDDISVRVWNLTRAPHEEQVITEHEHYVMGVSINPNTYVIATCGLDGFVVIFHLSGNMQSYVRLQKLGPFSPINTVDFYRGKDRQKFDWLVIGCDNGMATVIDYFTAKKLANISCGNRPVTTVVFEQDLILCGGEDSCLTIIDVHSLVILKKVVMGGGDRIWNLSFVYVDYTKSSMKIAICFDDGLQVETLRRVKQAESYSFSNIQQLCDVTVMALC